MSEVTYSQALNMGLREEMRRDPRVFCLGEDIKDSTYGVTRGLYDEFGAKRVIGTPISEAAIGGAALGAAAVGMRPVAEFMYMTFMMCAMDQLVNQAGKMKYMFGGKAVLPIVYRTMAGAGRANAAQHTQDLASWFSHVPGMKVVMRLGGVRASCARADRPCRGGGALPVLVNLDRRGGSRLGPGDRGRRALRRRFP